jgi:phage replication O-like protein O
MANPKLENGYTRIAHELLEQIVSADFSGAEFKILFAIVRQTYGYQKKSAPISMSQFSQMCGLHEITVSKTVKKLIEKNVVEEVKSPGFAKCREVALNKNYTEWLVKRLTLGQNATVSQTANKRVSQTAKSTVSQTANPSYYIKDNFKNNFKDRERPSLEEIKIFAKLNNVTETVAEKFFSYYSSRDWKTNGGTDVSKFWREKLVEWQSGENPKKNYFENYATYDKALVEQLINKD